MSPFVKRIGGFALAAAIVPAPAGATIYQMTNLPDVIWNTIGPGLDPGHHTQFAPTGINDLGTIIGTAWAGPLDRSVVALIAPGLTSTTTYAAGNTGGGMKIQLDGYKVNNNGDFVGDAYTFITPVETSPAESFIWANNSSHLLNVAPGADNRAFGINDSQTVVGGVQAVQYISQPPFTVTPGVTDQIPELSTGDYHVEDINDSGVIVGTKDANYFNGGQGFIDDNGAVTLFSYPGATRTFANGISNDGVVVGSWSDAQGYWHGYTYDNGVFTNISLPNNVSVYLEGINDSGQIVGEYAFESVGSQQEDGFLLTPEPGITDGLFFVGDLPPRPPPLTVYGPVDLSLIALLPLKEFRAVPAPEPSTWAMIALGFAGLGAIRISRSRRVDEDRNALLAWR
jgi:probable HAF family extracellular repeat protein